VNDHRALLKQVQSLRYVDADRPPLPHQISGSASENSTHPQIDEGLATLHSLQREASARAGAAGTLPAGDSAPSAPPSLALGTLAGTGGCREAYANGSAAATGPGGGSGGGAEQMPVDGLDAALHPLLPFALVHEVRDACFTVGRRKTDSVSGSSTT